MNVEQDCGSLSRAASYSTPQVVEDATHPEAVNIRVMLASDREALHAGWLSLLADESDIDIIRAEPITDASSLAACVEQHLPTVLLLDKPLLDELDAASLRSIQDQCRHVRVLLLWDDISECLVAEVLRYRFNGLLLTTSMPEIAMKAIRAVSRGELWMSRWALAIAIEDLSVRPDPGDAGSPSGPIRADGSESLTARELQVAALVRRGCLNKEIARELCITEGTVKKHLQSVFAKLGVHCRTQVALRRLPGTGATGSENQRFAHAAHCR